MRRAIRLRWNGRSTGRRLRGPLRIRLVGPGHRRASAPVTIDRKAPALADLTIEGTGAPFAGDRGLLATISPNGDGYRDAATIRFRLVERATVRLEVATTVSEPVPIYELTTTLPSGRHELRWAPCAEVWPRTYLIRLTVRDVADNRRTYGAGDAKTGRLPPGPAVRALGLDAALSRASYAPGPLSDLTGSPDARAPTCRSSAPGPRGCRRRPTTS